MSGFDSLGSAATNSRDRLIDEIQRDALTDAPLSSTLRKVIALGDHLKSERLRAWARHELKGYASDEQLPAFRSVGAPLCVDAIVGYGTVKGQRMSPAELPDFTRDVLSEVTEIRYGVAELEHLLNSTEAAGRNSVHLSPSGAAEIVAYMNHEIGSPVQHIQSLYWSVSLTSLVGILDHIRTALVELMVEIRPIELPDASPAADDIVDRALNIAVYGDHSNVVVASQEAGGTDASSSVTQDIRVGQAVETPKARETWWTRTRIVGAAVGGILTALVALTTLYDWWAR